MACKAQPRGRRSEALAGGEIDLAGVFHAAGAFDVLADEFYADSSAWPWSPGLAQVDGIKRIDAVGSTGLGIKPV